MNNNKKQLLNTDYNKVFKFRLSNHIDKTYKIDYILNINDNQVYKYKISSK
jgi:hypothetical protein